MIPEIRRHLPINTRPTEFMRPPTEALGPLVADLCRDMEALINQRVIDIVLNSDTGRGSTMPTVRMGSELEIFLFAADSTPDVDVGRPRSINPNYQPEHLDRVKSIIDAVLMPSEKGGIGDVLEHDVTSNRIFMEIRTLPSDVEGYFQAMNRIQRWYQEVATSMGIHLSVDSQHIHLSITGENGYPNVIGNKTDQELVTNGLIDTYGRMLAFVRLPEQVESNDALIMSLDVNGVKTKGSGDRKDPTRLEGRINNNSYAFDPYLNLFVNLMGVYRGLVGLGQSTYPWSYGRPGYVKEKDGGLYFRIGKGYTNYDESLAAILEDPVLQEYIPPYMLMDIQEILGDYWDISRGTKTASEVRDKASNFARSG